ncbi:hypothetical protein H4219_001061 [Mycoemilia scoparia]|uniref:CRAL-TRIO domain-containing protein n=1 Tax=Mycoemilia scoparia TaxID=417184 RepID=A0A9W8A182_9FUNG|nr:hypothetical protein H4219_001061 [Mycoemilia scoparia]
MPIKITTQFETGELDLSGCCENLKCEEKTALKEFWRFMLNNKSTPWKEVESDPVAAIDTSSDKKENNPDESIEVYEGCTYGQTVEDKLKKDGKVGKQDKIVPTEYETLRLDDSFGEAFWSVIREDNPDVLFLRFLRARKWDLERAKKMGAAAVKWRIHDNVEEIIWYGESKNEASLMAKGVSFVHGADRLGHPIIWSPSSSHHQRDQPFGSMKRYLIWMMETSRQLLRKPIEKVCLIMDLTGHSNSNMDWPFVKMFVKILESYYPECLALCIVYNGPWWFSGVYKMIAPLLDPVVAAKIQFAKNVDGLKQFIDEDQILTSRGGKNVYEFKYVPPTVDENAAMADLVGRKKAVAKWREAKNEVERLTEKWIVANNDDSELEQQRLDSIKEYVKASVDLDKYTRARHMYHRIGALKNEVLDWSELQKAK